HALLDGAQGGCGGLGDLGGGDLHGGGAYGLFLDRSVDDGGGLGVLATVAAGGGHRLVCDLWGESGLDEGAHGRGEGDVDVGLGQAPKTTVGAHHTSVVGQGEHRPRGEGVPLYGGDGVHRQGQHPGEESVHGVGVLLVAVGVVHEPVQVQAVGVELAGGRGDQGARALCVLHLFQGAVDRTDPVGVEAVLPLPEIEDEDVVVAFQCGHRELLLGGTGWEETTGCYWPVNHACGAERVVTFLAGLRLPSGLRSSRMCAR